MAAASWRSQAGRRNLSVGGTGRRGCGGGGGWFVEKVGVSGARLSGGSSGSGRRGGCGRRARRAAAGWRSQAGSLSAGGTGRRGCGGGCGCGRLEERVDAAMRGYLGSLSGCASALLALLACCNIVLHLLLLSLRLRFGLRRVVLVLRLCTHTKHSW